MGNVRRRLRYTANDCRGVGDAFSLLEKLDQALNADQPLEIEQKEVGNCA